MADLVEKGVMKRDGSTERLVTMDRSACKLNTESGVYCYKTTYEQAHAIYKDKTGQRISLEIHLMFDQLETESDQIIRKIKKSFTK